MYWSDALLKSKHDLMDDNTSFKYRRLHLKGDILILLAKFHALIYKSYFYDPEQIFKTQYHTEQYKHGFSL